MPPIPRLDLKHTHRGSWFAEANDVRTRRVIGSDPIPVIRDVGNGDWCWTGREPPAFHKANDPEWFARAGRDDWLAAFGEGTIVWIRGGTAGPGGRAEGSKGVWRIGDVVKGEGALSFKAIQRIGDVR